MWCCLFLSVQCVLLFVSVLGWDKKSKTKNEKKSKNNRERMSEEGVEQAEEEEEGSSIDSENEVILVDVRAECSENNKKSLQYWGVPKPVVSAYQRQGIRELYDWQCECLSNRAVMEGRNLVYTSPTGGGKSIVAEILMARSLQRSHNENRRKKALFVLPLVSIVVEKTKALKKLYRGSKWKVRGFYGDMTGTLDHRCDIAVCTIEKANSIINRLVYGSTGSGSGGSTGVNTLLSTVGIVIIDELHMVTSKYILEILLSKLTFAQQQQQSNNSNVLAATATATEMHMQMQIIGLSATLPNVSMICQWLRAVKYESDQRAVPLQEYIVAQGGWKYDKNGIKKGRIARRGVSDRGITEKDDPRLIVSLCASCVQRNKNCIVFCHSKKRCERMALQLAKILPKMLYGDVVERMKEKRQEVLNKLKKACANNGFELDSVLKQSVIVGVGYHHAGLTTMEREIIEEAYRERTLAVITATSTVGTGINMPAFCVIFESMKIGISDLSVTEYKQMSGRAGRAGYENKGESYVFCGNAYGKRNNGNSGGGGSGDTVEMNKALALLNGKLPPLESCLQANVIGLSRILNDAFAARLIKSAHDIQQFIECTLLSVQLKEKGDMEQLQTGTQDALSFLGYHAMIVWEKHKKVYQSTKLSLASFSSSIDPCTAVEIHRDLSLAMEYLITSDPLLLVYEVTPLTLVRSLRVDWKLLERRVSSCNSVRKDIVYKCLGLNEGFWGRIGMGNVPTVDVAVITASVRSRYASSMISLSLVVSPA